MAYQKLIDGSESEVLGRASDSSRGSIEHLRLILEARQGRPIGLAEAEEVGESLISFFEVLAEADRDEATLEVNLTGAPAGA